MCDYERGHLVLRADVAELVLCRSMASRACAPCIIKASLTEQNSHSKHHVILSLHVLFSVSISRFRGKHMTVQISSSIWTRCLNGVSKNGYFVIFVARKDERIFLWRTRNLYSITLTDTYVFTWGNVEKLFFFNTNLMMRKIRLMKKKPQQQDPTTVIFIRL